MSLELMISRKIEILKDRSDMLSKARAFFANLHILEVDCPIATLGASVDAHIDLLPALFADKETRYMHSSPEYGMKRLLSEGMGDIYQLSHVFRDGECGDKHNPEFTMMEWYRVGMSFENLIEETADFKKSLPFAFFHNRTGHLARPEEICLQPASGLVYGIGFRKYV